MRSEPELSPELADPRAADGVGDYAEIDRVLQIVVRICKVNRVENVEQVKAQFEAHPLVDPGTFCKAQIKPFLHRAAERVASEVSELAARRTEAGVIDHP